MKNTPFQQQGLKAEQEPDEPYKQLKEDLTNFLLSLIQALLRTGYYTPDHPQSQNAKTGLYEDFHNLFANKGELTILVRDDRKEKRILIEGLLPGIQQLNALMFQGMADTYTPKFVKFLERKDLISLSLKSTLTATEFTNFIDVLSEPTFVNTHSIGDKERFSRTLKDKGILNVSYIFNQEVLAMERRLPWRSRIAISRLKKDFTLVPLYYDLAAEGLIKVRKQIIQDVARPLQNAEAICPILLNTDLAETEEFREPEIDEEVITCLSDDLLFEVSKTLLKETIVNGQPEPPHKKLPEVAKRIASHLNQRKVKERVPILEEYVRRYLISLEALPKAVQRKIRFEQRVDRFLKNSSSFLDQFDKIQDKEKYLHAARSFIEIFPELIFRDRYKEVLQIITRIQGHLKENKHISAHVGQVVKDMTAGEVMRALKVKFLGGATEIRKAIAPIFLRFGKSSVPHLIGILKDSNDHLIRKNACQILARIDSSSINLIIDELNNAEVSTKFVIDTIRALGEVRCEEWIQPLDKILRAYLIHENPYLKEEALWVYYKIMDVRGENLYLCLLNDMDIGVQKKAIQCLGKIKSKPALGKFVEMLKMAEDGPLDESQQIETSLFDALGFYGNLDLPEIGFLEDFLLDTVDRNLSMGPLKFLKRKKDPLDPKVVGAICRSLGRIGTDKSLAILKKLEKQNNGRWKNRAQDAMTKIAKRQQNQTPSANPP